MNINKPLVVSVLSVLVLVVLYYYFDTRIKDNDTIEKMNLNNVGKSLSQILDNIEHFDGAGQGELIQNGSFAGGRHIKNSDKNYNKTGTTGSGLKIVKDGSNGGVSQHYLKISKGSVGYRLHVNLKAGKHYRLSGMWKGDVNANDNLYNIVMKTTDQRTVILSCNGKQGHVNGDWKNMVYVFKTPANLKKDGTVDIYLTYKSDVIRDVTDISLSQVDPNSANMPNADSTQVYLSGTKYDGNLWSGNGTMRWNKKPNVEKDEAFLTQGNQLIGGKSDDLLGENDNSFTVLLYAKGREGKGNGEVLSIGGGQKTSLNVYLPNGNNDVKFSVDGGKIEKYGKIGVSGGGEHVYAIKYDNESSKLYIYVDGNELLSGGKKIKKLYYNKDPLVINADGEWDVLLYGVSIHNKALSSSDVLNVGEYMRSNKGRVAKGGMGINAVTDDSVMACNGGNMSANKFVQAFDDNASINYNNDNDPDVSDNYYDRVGKNKLLELCMIEADMNPTGANEACQAYDRRFGNSYDCQRNDYCPPAYYKAGKFWVYIPKKSYWAKKYGYWGARSYSNDIDNARAVYQVNFPECRIPDVLRKEKYMGDMSKCPFIINKDNPCNDYSCKKVDWTDPKHFDKEVDNKCRISVNKYCTNNWDKDASCVCWNPDYIENATCKEYRKKFSGIDWSLFNVNDFAIEDHKDYDKIVNTARSTCWGCSGSGETASDRRYIVQVETNKLR